MGTINRSALRDFRLARGWSLSGLAARVGITKGYLSKIESGSSPYPNPDLIRRLAGSLGVDIASITHPRAVCPDPAAHQTVAAA